MAEDPLQVDVNGRLVAADAPAIAATDRGFLYGDGLFETIRAYRGTPWLLGEHLERLAASAAELRITDRLDAAAIQARIERLLEANRLTDRDAYLRITLTRGLHAGALTLEPAAEPTLTLIARPLRALPDRLYGEGITAITASVRQNADSPLPRHKTLNYLGNLLAKTEARDRGADEAILLNTRGEVAEAASSNLFIVRDGRLVTPPVDAGILPGITRRQVLRLAHTQGIDAAEHTLLPADLLAADEIFLTNAVVELLPLRSLDAHPIPAPGPLTRRLLAAYRDAVAAAGGGNLS